MRTLDKPQAHFAAIVEALTAVNVQSSNLDAELLTHTAATELQNLAGLELKLRAMRTPLPNGTMVCTHDFEALSKFAQSNRTGLERFQDGIHVDEGSGRVIYLRCGWSHIRDTVALAGLTSLKKLDLSGNDIQDISPLSGLASLEKLELYKNLIRDISALAGLTSLKNLRLDQNCIQDIRALSDLTSLEHLDIGCNRILDLSPLTKLSSLKHLGAINNGLQDISVLSDLSALKVLIISANRIADLSALSGLTSLTYASIDKPEKNSEEAVKLDLQITDLRKRGVNVELNG